MGSERNRSTFDGVDWDAVDASGQRVLDARLLLTLLGVVAVCVAFVYDYRYVEQYRPLVGGWNPTILDWLFLLSVVCLVTYVVVPVLRRPDVAVRYWERYRTNRSAVAALAVLVVWFLAGLLGPLFVPRPTIHITHAHQPPVFTTVSNDYLVNCVGTVAHGKCYATWQHPLGTNRRGKDYVALLVHGARISLQIALVTSTFVVPIATTVGTVAAYVGGLADEVLFRYVDFEQTIPTFFVYVVLRFEFGASVSLLVLTYGLFNWGGVARLVRSEALSQVEEQYIRAAENAGGRDRDILLRHVIPNVSSTVLTAATLQVPRLILIGAIFSFMDLLNPRTLSWGEQIALGLPNFELYWWTAGLPIAALFLTLLSLSLFGDALRDAVDPKAEW